MSVNPVLKLMGDIREALDTYVGDQVRGPAWEGVIELFANAIHNAGMDIEGAARLNYLLQQTRGEDQADRCPTCHIG